MRLNNVHLAWLLAVVACGTSASADGGVQDAAEECSGPAPTCCAGCLNDVRRAPVCAGGSWACPAGAVTEADCVGKCAPVMFCTYLPGPECVSCVGGTTSAKVCNEDAGLLECPAGTYKIQGGDAGVCDAHAE